MAPPIAAAPASESAGGSGGSGLLLRLFESSFFNVHLAVSYLKTYPANVGVTHYLVQRLREFDSESVEFYWPQLLYLLITRPTQSVALENFVLERCESNPQITVITLWYLQSSLSDLSVAPQAPAFQICHRLLNRVSSLIYSDPPIPSAATPEQRADAPILQQVERDTRMNATVPLLIGMSSMAASVGAPHPRGKDKAKQGWLQTWKRMLLEQGRKNEALLLLRREPLEPAAIEANEDSPDELEEEELGTPIRNRAKQWGDSPTNWTTRSGGSPAGKGRGSSPVKVWSPATSAGRSSAAGSPRKSSKPTGKVLNYIPGPKLEASTFASPSSSNSYSTPALARSAFANSTVEVQKAAPTPPPKKSALSASTSSALGPPASLRPASGRVSPAGSTAASASAPYLPLVSSPSSPFLSSPATPAAPFAGLPPVFLRKLLCLQACRSQLDLLRSLQDISTRLVLVPRPARLSALRAELTVLNHGLPRGCGLGLSCDPALSRLSSADREARKGRQDRIVRISPGESVVLNSADRAPFVVFVEVLEGDLDFDPARRANGEDLRRAWNERSGTSKASTASNGGRERGSMDVRRTGEKEQNMRRAKSENVTSDVLDEFAPSPSPTPSGMTRSQALAGAHLTNGSSASASASKSRLSLPAPTAFTEPPEDDGEMDLVEQLYGSSASLRALVDAEGDPTPEEEEIQNLKVDEAAWSRRSPRLGAESSEDDEPEVKPEVVQEKEVKPGGRTVSERKMISLTEYSDRMRMAAVMLAQLDASQTQSMGVAAKGTAAAGALVGLPVTAVTGVGGLVGAGLGAVASTLRGGKRDVQAGQASTGLTAELDTASAASGTSAVSGLPPAAPNSLLASPSLESRPSFSAQPGARQRTLSYADAQMIRNRIMSEMMALEEERMERMRADASSRSSWAMGRGDAGLEDATVVRKAVNKDDPSGAVLGEPFASKVSRIRAASPFGHLANWNVISVIVKTGADLRQEQFAVQLVSEFGRIWAEEKTDAWVRYFRILVTSESSGLIETITDAVSVHSIKKDAYARTLADGSQAVPSFSLYDHFVEVFGQPHTKGFRKAQECFARSLASYSVICYLLQLKDRHNGNILVDRQGHVIHIDFGFLLSNSPGSLGFEMAPFKLTQEYVDILGGLESAGFAKYKELFKKQFLVARKHAERIIMLVELMQKDSPLPCFGFGENTSQQLRDRFQLSLTQAQVEEFVEKLFVSSAMSTFTRLYDLFQYSSNGIL